MLLQFSLMTMVERVGPKNALSNPFPLIFSEALL